MLEEARVILKQIDRPRLTRVVAHAAKQDLSIIGARGGTYFHPLIPSIIREYRMRYPDIVLAPENSNSSLLLARLRAGSIDVAFIWPPISDRDDLTLEPLFDEDIVIVVPRACTEWFGIRTVGGSRQGTLYSAAARDQFGRFRLDHFGLPPRGVQPKARSGNAAGRISPSRLSQPAWAYP